jgi:hypothetical protein
VAAKLGLELPELEGLDLLRLDGRPLAPIRCWPTRCRPTEPVRQCRRGRTVAVACAACYSRLKTANHHIAGRRGGARQGRAGGGRRLRRPTPVRHLLEILCRDIGLARIAAAIRSARWLG